MNNVTSKYINKIGLYLNWNYTMLKTIELKCKYKGYPLYGMNKKVHFLNLGSEI